jgi:DNA-binding response OmpR family regulator
MFRCEARSRLLLVEDDADLREALEEILKGAGYEVIATGSVHDARDVLDMVRPDVVVSDIDLDGETGLHLVRYVRANRWAMPVVLMSGSVCESTKRAALLLGASVVFQKPVHPKVIMRTLALLLREEELKVHS